MNSKVLLVTGLIMITALCNEKTRETALDMEKIYAWCFAPYDSINK